VGIALVCDLPPREVDNSDLFAQLFGYLWDHYGSEFFIDRTLFCPLSSIKPCGS
jgi:hypothetical protein